MYDLLLCILPVVCSYQKYPNDICIIFITTLIFIHIKQIINVASSLLADALVVGPHCFCNLVSEFIDIFMRNWCNIVSMFFCVICRMIVTTPNYWSFFWVVNMDKIIKEQPVKLEFVPVCPCYTWELDVIF